LWPLINSQSTSFKGNATSQPQISIKTPSNADNSSVSSKNNNINNKNSKMSGRTADLHVGAGTPTIGKPLRGGQPIVHTTSAAQHATGAQGVAAATAASDERTSEHHDARVQDDGDFKPVVPKKRRKALLVGKATEKSEMKLKAVERKAHIFIGRLDQATTIDDLKDHICNIIEEKNENVLIEKLDCKGKTASFKAIFPISKLELIKNEELWPSGTILNRFFYKKVNFQSQKEVPLPT
jgi:hypothetical protein